MATLQFPAGVGGATYTGPNGVTYTYDGTAGVWTAAGGGGGGSFLPLTGGTMTGAIVNAAGSAAAPSLSFTGDTDTGFYSASANTIGIAANGSYIAQIGSSGFLYGSNIGTGIGASVFTNVSGGALGLGVDASNYLNVNYSTAGAGSVPASNLSFGSAGKPIWVYSTSTTPSNGVYLAVNGTTWTSNSDERLKKNLEPITDGLNKVASLRAVTGHFKTDEDTDPRRSFLIAQDVVEVLPEAVNDRDAEYMGLSYTDVIPLLVSALHDAKEEIDALKARLDAAGV